MISELYCKSNKKSEFLIIRIFICFKCQDIEETDKIKIIFGTVEEDILFIIFELL